jgi:hypothetical protein
MNWVIVVQGFFFGSALVSIALGIACLWSRLERAWNFDRQLLLVPTIAVSLLTTCSGLLWMMLK